MTDAKTNLQERLPQELRAPLETGLRRLRRVALWRGLLAVLAFAVLSVMAVMAVDAATVIFSGTVRWLLSGAAFAVTGLAGWLFLARPLRRVISLAAVARRLEEHHPELEERLSSAVELLTSRDGPGVLGSQALIAQLVAEACVGARGLEPEREFTTRPVRPFLVAALIAVSILLVLFAAWPSRSALLLARAVAPFAPLGNLRASELTVRPGSTVCARGSALEVEAVAARMRLPDAEFRWAVGADREASATMQRADPEATGGTRFRFRIDNLAESLRYRVHCGGALSAYYTVQVFDRPVVTNLVLRYELPPYTGQAPRETVVPPRAQADIRAVAGTKVTVSAGSVVPLNSIRLQVNGKDVPGTPARGRDGIVGGTWTLEIAPRMAGRWSLLLEDRHGLASAPFEYAIAAEPDAPPQVVVLSPAARTLRVRPTDRMTFEYEVVDDFGCTNAAVMVVPEGAAPLVVPAERPVFEEAEGTWRGRAGLDLALTPLPGVRKLKASLRVLDNCPAALGGPQSGSSEEFTLELDGGASPFVDTLVGLQDAEIRNRLNAALNALRNADALVAEIVPWVATPGALEPHATNRVDRGCKLLTQAEAGVRSVVDLVPGTTFAAIGPPAAELAERHLTPAREALELTALTDGAMERSAQTQTARREIDRSMVAIEALVDLLGRLSAAIREAENMREMADRERELAARARAEQAETPNPAWQAQQAQIANEITRRTRSDPAAMAAALSAFRTRVEALAAELRALAERQTQARELTGRGHRAELPARERTELDRSLRALGIELAVTNAPDAAASAADVRAMMQRAQVGVVGGVNARRKALEAIRKELTELEAGAAARPAFEEAAKQMDVARGEAQRAADTIVIEATTNSIAVTQRAAVVTAAQGKAAAALGEAAEKLAGSMEALAAEAAARRAEVGRRRAEEAQRRAEFAAKQTEREIARAGASATSAQQSADASDAAAKQAQQRAEAARDAAAKAAQAEAEAKAKAAGDPNQANEDAAKLAMQAERQARERAEKAQAAAEAAAEHAAAARERAQSEKSRAESLKQQQDKAAQAAANAKLKALDAKNAHEQAMQLAALAKQKPAVEWADMAWTKAVEAEEAADQAQQAWDQAAQADENGKEKQDGQEPPKASMKPDDSGVDKKGKGGGAGAGKGRGVGPTPGASIQLEKTSVKMPGAPSGGVGGEGEDSENGQPVSEELARIWAELMAARGAQNSDEAADRADNAAEGMERLGDEMSRDAGAPENASPVESSADSGQSASSGPAKGGRRPGGRGGGGGRGGATPARYRISDIAPDDWTRLPSELREQILQSVGERTPEEYRELVQEYFRRIATQPTK